METLRASIEIFTGLRVKYEHISFRRSRASIIIAGKSRPIWFSVIGTNVDWCFDMGNEKPNEWLTTTPVDDDLRVYFHMRCDNQVRVYGQDLDFYWCGQDHTKREVRFVYPEHAARVAREEGFSFAKFQAEVTALITARQSLTWK